MPSALIVSTQAVKVTLPLFFGVYVPDKSLILMGVLAGIASAFAGPETWTFPVSAPPTSITALGFMAPLPSSTGLEETPFWKDMVSL
ncbi:hypothetical protein SMICM304S_04123 [Streptomyces microflavus]